MLCFPKQAVGSIHALQFSNRSIKQKGIPDSRGTRSKTLYTLFIMVFLHTFHVHLHPQFECKDSYCQSTFINLSALKAAESSNVFSLSSFSSTKQASLPKIQKTNRPQLKNSKNPRPVNFQSIHKKTCCLCQAFQKCKNGLVIKTKHLLQNFQLPSAGYLKGRMEETQNDF